MTLQARSIRVPLLLTAALLLVGVAARADQTTLLALRHTPAWSGETFVAAYNARDAAALDGYLRAHLSSSAEREHPVQARVADLLRLREITGPLDPVEISGVPHALIINAGPADVIVIADGADPSRLAALRVVPAEAEAVALRGAP